jgi:hypothetical protein
MAGTNLSKFKLTRISHPLCNNCEQALSSIIKKDDKWVCGFCSCPVDYEWWKKESSAAYEKMSLESDMVICDKCGTEIYLIPENQSLNFGARFMCYNCSNIVLDATCNNCFDYHTKEDGTFYECSGFNPSKVSTSVFTLKDFQKSKEVSIFIKRFAGMCRSETEWDFPQTRPEIFSHGDFVIVKFDDEHPSRPVGYVTVSTAPPESPCDKMIADLYVIESQRKKGYAKMLLKTVLITHPNIIQKGIICYSSPATDAGMVSLNSVFSDLTLEGV